MLSVLTRKYNLISARVLGQIGSYYGHSFGNWSAGLGDDMAIVELKKLW
jgi:uncharacterized protein YdiU (UPF0061 family)